ncbi:MAG: BON domain-containing protein [Planctomycetota bacterium]
MHSTPKQVRCRIERTLSRLEFDGIDVAVDDDGNVNLLGTVPSLDDRSLAVAAVKTVAGVVTVTSQLK